jgi:methylenetetrahydrofolate reductase (NADPH)
MDGDSGPFTRATALLDDWSLEITAKDVDHIEEAAPLLRPGTQISITFLPNQEFEGPVRAAALVRQFGFDPIPHIAARRLRSVAELERFLDRLASESAVDRVFVVAGDAAAPIGPFGDALAIIRTELLGRYGVRHVGIAGYPEGHPAISQDSLWQALIEKQALLQQLGHDFSIVTQFGFDAEPILTWLEALRLRGVQAPVRAGLAGPTSVKTLLKFAARCGVGASAKIMTKYGASITRLFGSAGPDALIDVLVRGIDPTVHGDLKLHFYPFGGLYATALWARDFQNAQYARAAAEMAVAKHICARTNSWKSR